MDLQNKVLVLPNICGIEIDLSATVTPSLNPSLQPFYNSYIQNSTAKPVYFTPSKASLSETTDNTAAGLVFTQTLSFEFPANDPLRAQRISDYLKIKYVYIKLSSGMILFFGRNDYNLNTKPKVSYSGNEKTAKVVYVTKSIFSLGFTNGGSFDFQLPEDFPINFYNL